MAATAIGRKNKRVLQKHADAGHVYSLRKTGFGFSGGIQWLRQRTVIPFVFNILADSTMGPVFDPSVESETLQFTIGKGQVLHGVEQAVIGMRPQESKTVLVPAAEAYGPHRDEMTTEVQRSQFPDSVELQVGQRLQIKQKNGQSIAVSVLELSDSTVTLDANHPLAGQRPDV